MSFLSRCNRLDSLQKKQRVPLSDDQLTADILLKLFALYELFRADKQQGMQETLFSHVSFCTGYLPYKIIATGKIKLGAHYGLNPEVSPECMILQKNTAGCCCIRLR